MSSSPIQRRYHLSLVYSKSGKNIKLYLNGELEETKDYSSTIQFCAADAQIGNWPNRAFEGYMYEFRFWKTARTAAEVSNNFQQLLTGEEEGLISLFTLDGDAQDKAPGGCVRILLGVSSMRTASGCVRKCCSTCHMSSHPAQH